MGDPAQRKQEAQGKQLPKLSEGSVQAGCLFSFCPRGRGWGSGCDLTTGLIAVGDGLYTRGVGSPTGKRRIMTRWSGENQS